MLTVAIDQNKIHKVYVACADSSCYASTKLILNVAAVTLICTSVRMLAGHASFTEATGFSDEADDEADDEANPICLLTKPEEQKHIFCQRVGM